MCTIVKPSVFIVLPIIRNQSKTKTIPRTVSRYKFQIVSWWVFSVGDARNIRKSLFIKNCYWNLKLPIVALSNVIKCSH